MSKGYKIIPIFVPHRGCPFDCVFCNQKKITGLSTDVTKKDVEETIEKFIKTIPDNNKNLEVAFFGGSFTAIDLNIQRELLEAVYKYKKKGLIDRIRLSTRPDFIDDERLLLLKEYDVDVIELGVQSMDEEVLRESNRGHSTSDVRDAVELIKKYEFTLGLQMMIGLLGDTKTKSIDTGIEIIKLKPDFVRIYPTLVIKDTYLEKLLSIEKYKPLTIEETVEISCDLLMLFRYYRIPVIRIGLQPTENINLDNDVVAGPFHPSIRQLVESRIYRIILEEYFMKYSVKDKDITVEINNKEVSNFVGQKKENLKFLEKLFEVKSIKIKPSDISQEYFNIYCDGQENQINKQLFIETYLEKKRLIK